MAVGYYTNGNVAPLYDWGWIGPAAQMYSTITDLNKVHACKCTCRWAVREVWFVGPFAMVCFPSAGGVSIFST